MSLDYYALDKNAKIKKFNVNSCGADLLGYIHNAASARLSINSELLQTRFPGVAPRAAFEATAKQAAADAVILSAMPDDKIKALMEIKGVRECEAGTAEDFLKFAREWQAFLEQCGGYDTDPPPDSENEEA